MPEGIPVPESGQLLFLTELPVEDVCKVGDTPYGKRTVSVLGRGAISGGAFQGEVLPGGLDFELELSDGSLEVEQVLIWRMSDGSVLYSRNAGVGISKSDVRVVLDVEAPNEGPYASLNRGTYVARRVWNADAQTITLSVYEVFDVDAGEAVTLKKPTDHPPQPWENRNADASEAPGELLVSERVTLGETLSVGASKRGTRHIIPITGGELQGELSGKVLAGGADYQLDAEAFVLDARYLWKMDNGEFVVVRNVGTIDRLVPCFETSIDGNYAWLNAGRYLSSNPRGGDGAVFLDIHKSE